MCPRQSPPSRRAFLATSSTAILTATAGCTAIFDFVGEQFLEDVNVFNETKQRLEGTVQVTHADGETVLEETFDLRPTEETTEAETSDGGNAAFYADVWTGAGTYEASVSLESSIDGTAEATASVKIDNPDEEMLAIPLGADSADAPIAFETGTELSEFDSQ